MIQYSDAELEVIKIGEKVEALLKDKRFQEVIMDEYMVKTVITKGLAFDGEIKDFEAISHLNQWLEQKVDDAKNIRNSK